MRDQDVGCWDQAQGVAQSEGCNNRLEGGRATGMGYRFEGGVRGSSEGGGFGRGFEHCVRLSSKRPTRIKTAPW